MKTRLVLVTAVLLVVACSQARASELVRMNTPGGLSVVAEDDNREDLDLQGMLGPEGNVAAWHVGFSGGCITQFDLVCAHTDDSRDCAKQNDGAVVCTRTTSGVTVQLRGGDDDLDVFDVGGDSFSIDMGTGNDRVDSNGATSGIGNVPLGGATGAWSATLGSGDDLYSGSLGPDNVDGGSGADTITTLAGNDFVVGGSGNDTITPGPGNDGAIAGDGDDFVNAGPEAEHTESDGYGGGAGFDTLSYAARTSGVFVAKVGATGGSSGENDGIESFERILGGSGPDSILGLSSNGGGGDDVLTGGDGNDVIVGGRGADILRGFAGDDMLDANDGVKDTKIECMAGFDTVLLDLKDPNPLDAENCESIDRRAVDEEPGTQIASAGTRVRDGRAGVRVHCPRVVHRACAGTLTLALRHAGSARYRVVAGRSAVVTVAVGAADAARVRRAAHGLTAVVTSREHGLKGAETVIRRMTLRA
jgi:hypothetical protein